MALLNMLTPNRKKFLDELGITKEEDIPTSFFDTIESYTSEICKEERFCLSSLHIAFHKQGVFFIKDVVGTNHHLYANHSWLEAFLTLDNGEELLEEYFNNLPLFEKKL